VEQSSPSFHRLAEEDPTVRPLALLQSQMLEAATDPVWDSAAEGLQRKPAEAGVPRLHGQHLVVDAVATTALLLRLLDTARDAAGVDASDLRGALLTPAGEPNAGDTFALLEAAITWNTATLEARSREMGCDPAILATMGHLASQPLLLACHRRVENQLPPFWPHGYCPVCAAWPTLAEMRGTERQRWLRCGRCGAGWQFRHHECPFCSNADHRSAGYLAAESERESRRADSCESCKSYLKAISTLGPLSPTEVVLTDLVSLELDAAALEQGYGRPPRPGFPLRLTLHPDR
jgi:FdhE protein